MNTSKTLTAIAAVAVFGSVLGGQPAAAAGHSPYADAVSVTVSSGDLNLATEAGLRVMQQRIRRAANDLCTSEPNVQEYRACVSSITDQAEARLDSPIATTMNGPRKQPSNVTLASSTH
jgi:UrcA family protein